MFAHVNLLVRDVDITDITSPVFQNPLRGKINRDKHSLSKCIRRGGKKEKKVKKDFAARRREMTKSQVDYLKESSAIQEQVFQLTWRT